MKASVACVAILIVLALGTAFAQSKPLMNADVVKMVEAGFDDETCVKAIQANDTDFDLSVDGLLALKDGGVSQNVIDAMLEKKKSKKDGIRHALLTETVPEADPPKKVETSIPGKPAVYVEEVSSQGGIMASSDTTLEAIKTLQKKGIRVVTIKEKADYIVQITRQLGKKSWKKDTKVVVSNRDGEVVLTNSTRSVGGAMGDVAEYVVKHHE